MSSKQSRKESKNTQLLLVLLSLPFLFHCKSGEDVPEDANSGSDVVVRRDAMSTKDSGNTGAKDSATGTKDARVPPKDVSRPDTANPPGGLDLPNNAYCDAVQNWPSADYELELKVIEITNRYRAQGYNCHSGQQPAVGPVTLHPTLMCAARVHSKDMADNNYFNHNSQNGDSPWKRIGRAGGGVSGTVENIAAGSSTAQAIVEQWLTSKKGHCKGLMKGNAKFIGIGFAENPRAQHRTRCTQLLGR